MQVRVYHNEYQDHYRGFNPDTAELYLVAEFETDDLANPEDPVEVNRVLDGIWHQLNVDVPSQPWAQAYRDNRHRSLSCGDVIQLGDEVAFPFAVARMGFEAIPNAYRAIAIRRAAALA